MTPTQRMRRFRKQHPNYNKIWMRESRAKSRKATKMILGVRVKINLLGDADACFDENSRVRALNLQPGKIQAGRSESRG